MRTRRRAETWVGFHTFRHTGPSDGADTHKEARPRGTASAVPEDLDDPYLSKASGGIELPLHICWSGPPVTYDLNDRADRADRARVYEQVLREGTEDDVRYYVHADQLRELFDELVLPLLVQRAWTDWLGRHASARSSR